MNYCITTKPPLSPDNWPCEQPHVLLAIKQLENAAEQERRKKSTSIRDVEFQSSDDEESVYSPSESEASEELDDDEEEEGNEPNDAMDLDVDEDEVQDLTYEIEEQGWPWPPSPTSSEKERIEEAKFQEELQILEAAEKEAAAVYDPGEVVSLLTELYELLVEMAHWPEGIVRQAIHTDPAVNIELAKELGYEPEVIDLMQRLPYVKDQSYFLRLIFVDSQFCDYAEDSELEAARNHVGYDQYGKQIESWILPLVAPSTRDGWSVVLDTRLGVIRAYAPLCHPPKMSIEYRRHGKDKDNEGLPLGPLMYQRAPLVPAATYLRTLMECYRSLDRIPLWEQYWLGEHYHWRSSDYQETVQAEHSAVSALYVDCGWPDHWDRSMFTDKWKSLQVQLRDRRKERTKQE